MLLQCSTLNLKLPILIHQKYNRITSSQCFIIIISNLDENLDLNKMVSKLNLFKQNNCDYLILNEEWGKKLYKPLTQRVYACDSFTNEIYCALKLLGKWDICSYKLFILFRADCSEADIPGNSPVHNGLTQFGRVSFSAHNFVKIGGIKPYSYLI